MTDQPPFPLSVRELVAEYDTGTAFDISECVREPIHLLGSVQSRGVLLALAEPDLTIEVASTNAASLLGAEPGALVGSPAAELLGADQAWHPAGNVVRERHRDRARGTGHGGYRAPARRQRPPW